MIASQPTPGVLVSRDAWNEVDPATRSTPSVASLTPTNTISARPTAREPMVLRITSTMTIAVANTLIQKVVAPSPKAKRAP